MKVLCHVCDLQIFSPFISCPFILLVSVICDEEQFVFLSWVELLVLCLRSLSSPKLWGKERTLPVFCLHIFIFRTVICLELIFVQDGVNIESGFLLLLMSDYSNAIYWSIVLSLSVTCCWPRFCAMPRNISLSTTCLHYVARSTGQVFLHLHSLLLKVVWLLWFLYLCQVFFSISSSVSVFKTYLDFHSRYKNE